MMPSLTGCALLLFFVSPQLLVTLAYTRYFIYMDLDVRAVT